MKNKIIYGILVIVGIAVGWYLSSINSTENYVSTGTPLIEDYDPYIKTYGIVTEKAIVSSGASGDITVGDDLVVTDDATISGGLLDVTTAANATSSIKAGCIQLTPTSSATTIKLDFFGNASTTVNGSTKGFAAAWVFGICP